MRTSVRLLSVLGALLVVLQAVGFAQATTVTVSPATKTVNLPDQFTLDVRVNSVTNLRVSHIVVAYDHNVLQYDGTANGLFMMSAILFQNLVVNGSTATVTVDQALSGTTSKTGSGVLFTLYFTAKTQGTTAMSLQLIDLRDNQDPAVVIPATGTGGQVIVDPPLPIQLSSFAATVAAGNTVVLTWKTLSETDNLGFEIERALEPSGPFASLEGVFIAGHGTTIEPQEYTYTDMNTEGKSWYYRLKQIDRSGSFSYSDAMQAMAASGVEEAEAVPNVYALEQNYPNPFNPRTVISSQLPVASEVRLVIYDVLGREVAVLVDERRAAGSHRDVFDATGLPSGLYFYRLVAGSFTETRKALLVK